MALKNALVTLECVLLLNLYIVDALRNQNILTPVDIALESTLYDIVNSLNVKLKLKFTYDGFNDTSNVNHFNDKVKFLCFKPQQNRFKRVFHDDSDNVLAKKIVLAKPIALLVHGWLDEFNSIFLRTKDKGWMWRLSIDWAQFEDTNVCAVDWNILATNLYSIAAKNTKIVGKIISNFLIRLHRLGVPLDKMTVAGHSMGGQIAGYVGDFMKHENYYLNRIFALDPAGPMFTYPQIENENERLDANDARYVQVIHSSIVLGSYITMGHSDFYVNGGIAQPGCLTRYKFDGFPKIPTICNHFRAVEIFHLSLNQQNRFIGRTECNSKEIKCDVTKDLIGIHSKNIHGRFNLITKIGYFNT